MLHRPPTQIVFLHVPKSAGTSVAKVMRNHFGNENVHLVSEARYLDMPVAHLLRRWPIITGHLMLRFVSNDVLQRAFVFTFLRDPVERVVSQYGYFRSLPPGNPNPDVQAAQTMDLKDLLRRRAQPGKFSAWANWQTRIFAACAPHVAATAETLSIARHNLSQLAFVGLQEELEAGLAALVQMWGGAETPEVPRLNQTTDRTSAEALDEETRALIDEHHVFDHALYAHARDLWRTRHRPPEVPDLVTDLLGKAEHGTKEIEIIGLGVKGEAGGVDVIPPDDPWEVWLKLRSSITADNLTVGLRLSDDGGLVLYQTNSLWQGVKINSIEGEFTVTIKFPGLPLVPGQYNLSFTLHAGRPADGKCFHAIENALELKVDAGKPFFAGIVNLGAKFREP